MLERFFICEMSCFTCDGSCICETTDTCTDGPCNTGTSCDNKDTE